MLTLSTEAQQLALLFKRAGKNRARISTDTIRRLSRRHNIRTAFLNMVEDHLDDLGFILIELERGGYGLVPTSALDGAPAITAKRYLQKDLRGEIDFDAIRKELERGSDLEDDDEA